MASGWANDNAVNDQIASSLAEEIERIQSALPQGESLEECEECGGEIPAARRKAMPGVRLCLACQEEQDKLATRAGHYNRRGNKDSQLR